jgi:hypothetical protein
METNTSVKCDQPSVDARKVKMLGDARTSTSSVRIVAVALAFGVALALGLGHRLISGANDHPTPTSSGGERLLLPDVTVPYDPSFTFAMTQPGSTDPVTFDPCRPIGYVIRPLGSPAQGKRLVTEALQRVSGASGLLFRYDGTTTESPSANRSNFQPERYGDQWAPVLISWSTPAEYPELAGPVIGVTSGSPEDTSDGQLALVSGQVTLDAEQITDLLRYPDGGPLSLAVVTHEIGHLVGLGHVTDQRQLMYPSAQPLVTDFGAGDLTGLAAVGKGRCFGRL